MRLSELREMDEETLYNHWANGRFPFEYLGPLVGCSNCLTQHGYDDGCTCALPSHAALSGQVLKLRNAASPARFRLWLHQNLEALFALRLFYADLYKNPVPQDALEEVNEKEEKHATEPVETVVG